jgi:hypothetical protein
VDDFVFMCFVVGNDFLPHLPAMDIAEGGLNQVMEIYKARPSLCLLRLLLFRVRSDTYLYLYLYLYLPLYFFFFALPHRLSACCRRSGT